MLRVVVVARLCTGDACDANEFLPSTKGAAVCSVPAHALYFLRGNARGWESEIPRGCQLMFAWFCHCQHMNALEGISACCAIVAGPFLELRGSPALTNLACNPHQKHVYMVVMR